MLLSRQHQLPASHRKTTLPPAYDSHADTVFIPFIAIIYALHAPFFPLDSSCDTADQQIATELNNAFCAGIAAPSGTVASLAQGTSSISINPSSLASIISSASVSFESVTSSIAASASGVQASAASAASSAMASGGSQASSLVASASKVASSAMVAASSAVASTSAKSGAAGKIPFSGGIIGMMGVLGVFTGLAVI
jgi:hypothetical protein